MIFYAPKKFGVAREPFIGIGVVYWILIIILLYFGLNNVLTPAITNLTAPTPIAAPSSVFVWFPAIFIALVIITFGATLLMRQLIPDEHKPHIDSGLWIIGLVLILLPLSFYGAFGPFLSTSSAIIPFPYDNILTIIVGIIFYILAIYSGYQTEDIVAIHNELGIDIDEPQKATSSD